MISCKRSSPIAAAAAAMSAGSREYPFKLTIIGGGPAGCSVIVKAARLGLADDLCSGGPGGKAAGVCIVDKDSAERFGGGRLQDYVINSNTFSSKFYTNVCDEKVTILSKESIDGTPLVPLRSSAVGQELLSLGTKPAPLQKVGSFLCEVGGRVSALLRKHPDSSAVHTATRVDSIERISFIETSKAAPPAAPSAATATWGPEVDSPTSAAKDETAGNHVVTMWKIYCTSCGGMPTVIHSKNVCFSSGGYQDPSKASLGSASLNSKAVMSEDVISGKALADVEKRLQGSGRKRIVIVGGSHSAFSAAWVCLKHLSCFLEQPSEEAKGDKAFLPAEQYSICMLHRSPIQVFYASKKDADADKYADIGEVNKATGQIHPFGGLRGDAKELWRNVMSRRECRVKFVSTKGGATSIAQKMYEEAAVVIWACGYSSNTVPVSDENKKSVHFQMYRGQVEVDDEARILSEQGQPVIGLFGCGLGYGFKASFDCGAPDGSSGRADGVAVYLKRGASQILASVLGNVVYSGKGSGYEVKSWDERAALIKKLTADTARAEQAHGPDSHIFSTPPHSPLRRSSSSTSSRTELTATTPIDVSSRASKEQQEQEKRPVFIANERDQLSATLRLSQPKKTALDPVTGHTGSVRPLAQCRSVRAVSASLSGALQSKVGSSSSSDSSSTAKSQDDIVLPRAPEVVLRAKTSPKTIRFPTELNNSSARLLVSKRLTGGVNVERRLTQLSNKKAIVSSTYVLQLPTISVRGQREITVANYSS